MNLSILNYFSKHCHNVLKRAEGYAEKEGEKEVNTFHIFKSISYEKGSVGSSILGNLGIRRIVSASNLKGKKISVKGKKSLVPFSIQSRRTLVHAVKLAQDFQSSYVGTEHLLFAVLSSGDREIASFLSKKRVEIRSILSQLQQVLTHTGDFGGGPLTFLSNFQGGNDADREKKEIVSEIMGEVNNLFSSLYGKKNRRNNLNQFGPRPSFGLVSPRAQVQGRFLEQFAVNLNKEVLEGKLDPVIGRDKEVDELICILMRKNKNNPVLVGEPGVGKTAVVTGLAWKLLEKEVPPPLVGKNIYSLDLGLLVAGTSFRGEFEDRFKRVIEEAEQDPNIILFIDELHNLVGAGSAQGSLDAANIIKPALARGQIRCVGATTVEEYHKYIEKDGALERRFQSIWLKEPSVKETERILKGVRRFYESYHRVKISNDAIKAVARLSDRYVTDRFFPDKALDLLDEAASYVIQDEYRQGTVKELQKFQIQHERLQFLKEKMVSENYLDTAASLIKNEENLRNVVSKLEKKVASERKMIPVMDERDVAEVLARKMNLPTELIMEDPAARLGRLPSIVRKNLKGQDQAIEKVSSTLQRTLAGVADPERPSAAFLFVGPTGVGKTYMAKLLAKEIFMHPDSLIKIDMSEFGEKHTVSRLLGSPPGYVGYSEKNSFTDKIRKNPYSLILFDEIEKAHPEVFHILLQVLEDGILTDGMGRKISFKNAIIIFTSNLGNEDFLKEVMGFEGGLARGAAKAGVDKVKKKLSEFLKPEFLNRLSDIVFFDLLGLEEIKEISKIELETLKKRLKESKGVSLEIDEKVSDWLAKKSVSKKEGARLLRRIIREEVEEPIAKDILKGKAKSGGKIYLKQGKDIKITFPEENKKVLWQKTKKKPAVV